MRMNSISTETAETPRNSGRSYYQSVWRWHFYAGLICIPFAIWLAVTGAIYLFKPQIESWLDREYDQLSITGPASSPQAQVAAALAAVPGSVLNAYILPESPNAAVRILVGQNKQLYRVYIHPQSLQILKTDEEDRRLMPLLFHLHGELLLGDTGSIAMELIASWMIVLLITGIYLWWPRNAVGLAGVFYPRLSLGSRMLWRDLHAVTGLWACLFLLFLLISGLPWTKSWGGMLKQLRQSQSTVAVKQDWNTGRSSELAERKQANSPASSGHSGHGEHGGNGGFTLMDYALLDKIAATTAPLNLAPPVLIAPPNQKSPLWTARSDSQNRPLRSTLKFDPNSGELTERQDFAQKPLLDRVIGYGVAAHEGQLFGWFNQALGLFTAFSSILLGISSAVLWWNRRPSGSLGAPRAAAPARMPLFLYAIIAVLGVLLPLLGISLLSVLLLEYTVLRRIPALGKFIGLPG
jgi:uncharacterized iron-regulated membrane protein